eukprot:818994_1
MVSKAFHLLVHNVSHSDILVTLQPSGVGNAETTEDVIARPKFSFVKLISDCIFSQLSSKSEQNEIEDLSIDSDRMGTVPVGVQANPALDDDWHDTHFHIRTRTPVDLEASQGTASDPGRPVCISKVFFPLLSVVLPKWLQLCQHLNFESAPSSP